MKKDEKNLLGKTNKRDLLAQIRTLLALERNYLAEERTNLAKLRTGLAFLLISPPIYLFSIFLQITFPLIIIVILFFLFVISAGLGIWMITNARSALRKLRIKKKGIKNDINNLGKSSEIASELLGNYLI